MSASSPAAPEVPAGAEVAPSLGTQGFLPNVAVTSLTIFNSGNFKRLRAANLRARHLGMEPGHRPRLSDLCCQQPHHRLRRTDGNLQRHHVRPERIQQQREPELRHRRHGRPADLRRSPDADPAHSRGNYLSGQCQLERREIMFSVCTQSGSDPSSLTLDFSLTLHIVDFSLSPPSPTSVSVIPGTTTAPVSFSVSGLGSFAGTVAFSCCWTTRRRKLPVPALHHG